MAITVKHSKVSTIPDDADTSLVRPSDWNADHTLVGTIDVANGGTGATTLTGYVKGNGTSAMTAVATVPSTDITGLGTMSTQNANAVAITGGTINGTTIGATTQADITGNTINAFTKFVSPDYYAQSVLGGNLRTSGGTSLVNWDGGGSGNVTVNGGLLANPANKNVSIAPTGTGTATINPATAGTINNMSIGATTPAAGKFSTLEATGNSTLGTGSSQYIQVEGGATAVLLSAQGAGTNIPLALQPKGTGALQAQATTSSTAGGNARGANAVDWQTSRTAAGQVASGFGTAIAGGNNNTASAFCSIVAGGFSNTASNTNSSVLAGGSNTASGYMSSICGGNSNATAGYYNFVGNGFTNAGTSASAVTTQSGTMNATTAVTLSGSNANIKVGQYITGTSIASDTYVAAISGTALTLSKNASGSSTSTLSFFTPHGVVVGGGNNQATGSYSFIGGGGDAGTAANRNVASGDWSTVGGGQKNVASGVGSTIAGGGTFNGGGQGNTSSGLGSFVAGGWGNTSSGTGSSVNGVGNTANSAYSTALGLNATTRAIVGNIASSACQTPIGVLGVSQAALLVLGTQTTDATATALRSDANAASGTNQVILPNNSAYFFRGEVISGVTGGGDAKGFTIEGVIKRGANALATTLVGSTVVSTFGDAGAATWTIALSADTTNGGLRVTFTGQAGTVIRTVCQIRTTEMTY
jgi:hypothetical protein